MHNKILATSSEVGLNFKMRKIRVNKTCKFSQLNNLKILKFKLRTQLTTLYLSPLKFLKLKEIFLPNLQKEINNLNYQHKTSLIINLRINFFQSLLNPNSLLHNKFQPYFQINLRSKFPYLNRI